ncbi:MAG: ATP-grasp domain-containing protein, partial [Bacteroidales bacterium]|nr:ATP-grasp domain-containing protein [Bacteroidales bacterium]
MKNIAIVTGGNSSEYVISVKSAETIIKNIDKSQFTPYRIEIKGTEWTATSETMHKAVSVNRDDFSINHQGNKISFDRVLIMIHGTPGEDGRLQGYFDMLNIPYVNSGVLSSSLTFDKHFSKAIAQNKGYNTAPWLYFKNKDEVSSQLIVKEIGLPCFVKPTNAGSSFGVTKVSSESELEKAITTSFNEDANGLIAEKLISGREFTCGVINTGSETIAFPVCEIVSKKDFFDYEAKYTVGMADEIVPAEITSSLSDKIQALSREIYELFECK